MSLTPAPERLQVAYQTALETLLSERNAAGHWTGELSTSALSTATTVSALAVVQKHAPPSGRFDHLIADGLRWLAVHQNADGGWGDTVKSLSNISTTMLCRAAFHLCDAAAAHQACLLRAEEWLHAGYGQTPEELAEAVRLRYGKDRTFSVPILMTSALAGLVSWGEVPALPFELACFPQSWFRFLRLPVVSYALPALIAIGQTIYNHRPPRNPVALCVRWLCRQRSLRVLEMIQPSSGGFLEATPLTSFVTLALASSGQAGHPVVGKAVEFLTNSVRPDGSWPIDTNLATWVTTLAVNALAAAGDLDKLDHQAELRGWLLKQQFKERHPYTGADPGGWGWTDLPGSVPDADDTPGAILALGHLQTLPLNFVHDGLRWLWQLQNRDGGLPTFCRGWGKLPFDRSGSDLTAHTLRALAAWYDDLKLTPKVLWPLTPGLESLYDGGLAYLARSQRPDGSWLPLWFGNQHAPNDENPTYGTARVLAAYRDLHIMNNEPARRGVAWLLAAQNPDGGWGGAADTPSSMEETALAVEVLLDAKPQAGEAVNRGLAWLVQQVECGGLHDTSPIGFYFAKLWYFEKLYPIIFTVAALGRARQKLTPSHEPTRQTTLP
jgi:squalene-hopene/tetraprenyl-beta-curcumene cyclase